MKKDKNKTEMLSLNHTDVVKQELPVVQTNISLSLVEVFLSNRTRTTAIIIIDIYKLSVNSCSDYTETVVLYFCL